MHKHVAAAIATALSVAGMSAGGAHATHDHEIVVQPGESLAAISLRYFGDEEHVWAIARHNQLANPDLIYGGLRLALPNLRADGPTEPADSAASPTGAAASGPEPTPTTTPAPSARPLALLTTPGSPDAAPPGVASTTATSLAPGVAIESGMATWYGPGFVGNLTYCGEVYDDTAYTAASNTLPCGTVVVVVGQDSGASVSVRINDRGGFGGSTILDMTPAAFSVLAPLSWGVTAVTVYLPAQ
jgi:hypothetical protein